MSFRKSASAAVLVAAIGGAAVPGVASAAPATTQTHTYHVGVNDGILTRGQNTITANVKVTNPETSVRDFWSRASIQKMVRAGVNNEVQKPYQSEGFRCVPVLDGSMNASTARFTCKLQGADVPTTVTVTFTAPYLPATAGGAVAAQAVQTPAPQISAGPCNVRYSHDTGKGFTYAQCQINVTNVPYGKTVKVRYTSNLKTFNPHSEIGPFKSRTGTISIANQGGLPGQTKGTTADMTGGFQIAFPIKSAAQVKKRLKVTLSSATPGVVVSGATATVTG